jgi:hypothetical protein
LQTVSLLVSKASIDYLAVIKPWGEHRAMKGDYLIILTVARLI